MALMRTSSKEAWCEAARALLNMKEKEMCQVVGERLGERRIIGMYGDPDEMSEKLNTATQRMT